MKHYIHISVLCVLVHLVYAEYRPIYSNGRLFSVKDTFNLEPQIEAVEFVSRKNKECDETITRKGILQWYSHAQGTIVIAHGFMCDKYDVGFLRMMFPKGKFNLMTFDFRAHGENIEGQYCTLGRDEAYDVIGAGEFVRNHHATKDKPVFVYAFSMGAVSSIKAQAKSPGLFNAMILDCPFDSSETILKKGLEHLKFSFFGYEFDVPGKGILETFAFHPYVQSFVKTILKTVAKMDARDIQTNFYPVRTYKAIAKVTVPCCFIHCKNDEKVPIDSIKRLYEHAQGYKQLWITNGRHHFDSFLYNPEKYAAHVGNFLDRVLVDNVQQEASPGIIIDSDEGVITTSETAAS